MTFWNFSKTNLVTFIFDPFPFYLPALLHLYSHILSVSYFIHFWLVLVAAVVSTFCFENILLRHILRQIKNAPHNSSLPLCSLPFSWKLVTKDFTCFSSFGYYNNCRWSTVMHYIVTFRPVIDGIHNSGPIRLNGAEFPEIWKDMWFGRNISFLWQ